MKLIKIPILKTALASTFLGLLFLAQAANAIPTSFEANYSVAKGSMNLGNLHTSLKVSGGRYSYQKYTKATGLAALLTGIKITENTNGVISGNIIRPNNYLFNKKQRSKSKIDKIQFSENIATENYKGKSYKLNINNSTQDRASLELVLARDVALNKARLSYQVVESGEIKTYNFQKLGSEKIHTKAGTFNTVKVKVLRSSNKRETIFWLAKETGYMPVKIRHREKNDVIITTLKNYKKS